MLQFAAPPLQAVPVAGTTNDGRSLVDRLDELAKKGITLADANDEVGLYAQTALLVLARENEGVKALTSSLKAANGETQRMADIMRDNLSGDWDKFTSAVERFVLQGGFLNTLLRAIVQHFTDIITGLSLIPQAVTQAKNALVGLFSDGMVDPADWGED